MTLRSSRSESSNRVDQGGLELREGCVPESAQDAAVAKAYLRPEMVVADVSASSASMAAALVPLVSRIYAIDTSGTRLDVARSKLGDLEKVVFRRAEGGSLPLEDGSVDAVFAFMYLHRCDAPEAAIRELARIVRPGGRVVLTDLDAHAHRSTREESVDHRFGPDRSQVRSWLRKTGLVNIVVADAGKMPIAASQDLEPTTRGDEETGFGLFVAAASRRVAGVREAVGADYGALAEGEKHCCSAPPPAERACCSPGPEERVEFRTGYTALELDAVPGEAVGLSLGCGNPVAMASLSPGEVVLDIGSGGGIDVFASARRVGPTGRVIGLDMTEAMIDRARKSAKAAGFGHVEFRLGQAEAMPVENGEVDVVLSNCVINLCEDKGRVFEEAYRVLKPGGRLIISDMVSEGPLPVGLRQDATRWAGCVNGALPEREYLELIAQAGFEDVVPTRRGHGATIEGVPVFSLAVSARRRDSGGPP